MLPAFFLSDDMRSPKGLLMTNPIDYGNSWALEKTRQGLVSLDKVCLSCSIEKSAKVRNPKHLKVRRIRAASGPAANVFKYFFTTSATKYVHYVT
jgi:hypothetical protein